MKKCLCIFLLIGSAAFAQKNNEIDFSKLVAPSIPAFTILGVQPSEISQPKTWDAFETSVYNNFYNNGGLNLPKNYALELTPYWMNPKAKIKYSDYVDPTAGNSFLYNSAFSLATAEQTSQTDTGSSNLKMGIGYRTVICFSKVDQSPEYVKTLVNLHQVTQAISILLGEVTVLKTMGIPASTDSLKAQLQRTVKGDMAAQKDAGLAKEIGVLADEFIFTVIDDNSKLKPEDVLSKIEDKMTNDAESYTKSNEFTEKISTMINKRFGLNIEVAAAMTLDFPTNDIYFSKVPKYGIWITPSYKFSGKNYPWINHFEFLGVVRLMKSLVATDFTDNTDLGGKIVFETGKFSMNGELIQRFQKIKVSSTTVNNVTTTVVQSTQDFKATLNLNYRLNNQLILSYSFGKNYELNTENSGNLISLLSINYSLGKVDKKNLAE